MNYAERAIMETLLTYGIDASKNWLQAGLFYKDTAGKMDSGDPTQENGNLGLKQRAEFTSKSKLATVRGKLHLDIFNQPKPLINNSRLHVKLTQNNANDARNTGKSTQKNGHRETDTGKQIQEIEWVCTRFFVFFFISGLIFSVTGNKNKNKNIIA